MTGRILLLAVALMGCDVCVRTERRTVRYAAWVQFLPVGKTTMPIFHPARDVEEDVCVEWRPR